MRYPAEETAEKHEKILSEATRLFREKGFAGVSVGELMKSAGLTHGPFYNHFASKEALMSEVVESAMQRSAGTMDKYCADANGKGKYLDVYLSTKHRDARGEGCPMAAMAVEVGRDKALQAPFTRQLQATVEKMTGCFRWKSKRSARSEAIRATAAMVGALILARAVENETFSKEILHEVRKGLL